MTFLLLVFSLNVIGVYLLLIRITQTKMSSCKIIAISQTPNLKSLELVTFANSKLLIKMKMIV